MNVKKGFIALICLLSAASVVPLENSQRPKMIVIAGGTFLMGSNEVPYNVTEKVHEVAVSSFLLSETEVTQELYTAVMKENPSQFKGNDLPVESISWFEAIQFCNALSEQSGLAPAYIIEGDKVSWNRSSKGYRLPTESEWEYAARGGLAIAGETLSKAGFAGAAIAGDVAWYGANSGRHTQPVGKKLPNELGLYDMSGNVWEWCWDWFGDYPEGPVADPEGALSGRSKVFRGGAHVNMAGQLRITFRIGDPPSSKANSVGLRLAQNW